MNRLEAAEVLALLSAGGLRFTPEGSEENARIWMEYLRDVTRADGIDAVKEWIGKEQEFPTVAAFRSMARRIAQQRPVPRNSLATGESTPYKCRCNDTGIGEVDEEHNTWRPCERCNLPAYERWSQGSYMTKLPATAESTGTTEQNQERIAMLRASIKTIVKKA